MENKDYNSKMEIKRFFKYLFLGMVPLTVMATLDVTNGRPDKSLKNIYENVDPFGYYKKQEEKKHEKQEEKKQAKIEQLVQGYSPQDIFEVQKAIENARKFCDEEEIFFRDRKGHNTYRPSYMAELGAYTVASILCENNDSIIANAKKMAKNMYISSWEDGGIANWTAAIIAAKGDLQKVISTAKIDHISRQTYRNEGGNAWADCVLAHILTNNDIKKFDEAENKMKVYFPHIPTWNGAVYTAAIIAADGDLTKVKAAEIISFRNFDLPLPFYNATAGKLKLNTIQTSEEINILMHPSYTLAAILAQNNNQKKDKSE